MAKWKIKKGEPGKNYKALMDSIFDNGVVSSKSPKKLVLTDGTKKAIITGTKLKYDDDGKLIGGKVNSVKIFDGSEQIASITKINKKAVEFQGLMDLYQQFNALLPDDKNKFSGSKQDDLFAGGNRPDFLVGNEGNDFLYGNGGNDTINGGPGLNYTEGGAGRDKFYMDKDGVLQIGDFDPTKDKFVFRANEFDGLGKPGPIKASKIAIEVDDPTNLSNKIKIYIDLSGLIFYNSPNTPDINIGQIDPGVFDLMTSGNFISA